MHKKFDLSKVKTYHLTQRECKVKIEDFGKPYFNGLSKFISTLPEILAGKDLKLIINNIKEAKENKKEIIWFIGAHVIKVGLGPILIELMKRGFVSIIGMNGAGAIHDTEIAMIGKTSENVSNNLIKGKFGFAKETASLINDSSKIAVQEDIGFGEAIGKNLLNHKFEFLEYSIIANAYKLNIPITIHVAIGTDIVHMHPDCDGASIGKASYTDFLVMAEKIKNITGGVILNVGSSVILPLIIEKSLSLAQNTGSVKNFTGINLDFVKHYRANLNPVERAKESGGVGINLIGHHEIMIPLIASALFEEK